MSPDEVKRWIQSVSGQYDTDIVFTIDLDADSPPISDILPLCPNLEAVTCTQQFLSSLACLAACPKLQLVSITACGIRSLEGIEACPDLHTVELSGNQIQTLQQIQPLQSLHNLRKLTLRTPSSAASNTVTQVPGYRAAILALVPSLRVLDGSAIALDAVVNAALAAAPSPSTLSDADLGITGLDPGFIPALAREATDAVNTAGAAATRAAARASPAEQALTDALARTSTGLAAADQLLAQLQGVSTA